MQIGVMGLGRMGAGIAKRRQIAGIVAAPGGRAAWLLDLLGRALKENSNPLEHIADRFDSRVQTRFAHQVIAVLRKQFGEHAVREG